MNFTLFGAIAFVVLVTDSTAQFGGGFGFPGGFAGMFAPPAATNGMMMGQEASKNGVNFAVNSAMSKVDTADLSPELQEELQQALLDTEFGLVACDDFLTGWNIWRYKVCKFSELGRLKLKIQEIKLKASALETTEAPSTFLSDASSQSSASTA